MEGGLRASYSVRIEKLLIGGGSSAPFYEYDVG